MTATWKKVVGYPDYEVADTGQVRSWRLKQDQPTILFGSPDKQGYLRVKLRDPAGKAVTLKIHTIVCTAWHGPRPSGQVVRHLDGNISRNNQQNVSWGTYEQNSSDARIHGTLVQGTKVNHAKLTDDAVRVIRSSGRSCVDLAEEYGVTPPAISHARTGRTWKHVQ